MSQALWVIIPNVLKTDPFTDEEIIEAREALREAIEKVITPFYSKENKTHFLDHTAKLNADLEEERKVYDFTLIKPTSGMFDNESLARGWAFQHNRPFPFAADSEDHLSEPFGELPQNIIPIVTKKKKDLYGSLKNYVSNVWQHLDRFGAKFGVKFNPNGKLWGWKFRPALQSGELLYENPRWDLAVPGLVCLRVEKIDWDTVKERYHLSIKGLVAHIKALSHEEACNVWDYVKVNKLTKYMGMIESIVADLKKTPISDEALLELVKAHCPLGPFNILTPDGKWDTHGLNTHSVHAYMTEDKKKAVLEKVKVWAKHVDEFGSKLKETYPGHLLVPINFQEAMGPVGGPYGFPTGERMTKLGYEVIEIK